ncbi:MAG: hypothetical protein ACKOFH_08155, partial [Chthoniobacterales bacterium]
MKQELKTNKPPTMKKTQITLKCQLASFAGLVLACQLVMAQNQPDVQDNITAANAFATDRDFTQNQRQLWVALQKAFFYQLEQPDFGGDFYANANSRQRAIA